MNEALEGMVKEAVMACVKVLSHHLLSRTMENHKKKLLIFVQ
jgi:hypothetical protein